jgi:cell division protein FtsA
VSKTRLAVGIDAGSYRVRCLICELDGARVRLLGAGETASRGWIKGRIADQSAVSDCIRAAVREAEAAAGASADSAVIGIGGGAIEGVDSRGVYEFGRPREVSPGDLGYAVERASGVRIDDGRQVLQVFPQDFTVDGRAGFRNPQGVRCSRLEAHAYLITARLQDHEAIVAAVHQAHLAVEETVFEGMAAAYASILPEDRGRGVALIDIGSHSTELAIYDADSIVLAASLPIGGEHFTRDVAYCLTIPYEDATVLKEEYGCAIVGLTSDHSLIEVPGAEGRAPRETSRKQLNEILEARADELFSYVRSYIEGCGMEQSLIEGAVLTGGAARLIGMCDVAERVLNCPARNGLVLGMQEWPDAMDNPGWVVAAGLAMYSARLKLRREQRRKTPGLMNLVLR